MPALPQHMLALRDLEQLEPRESSAAACAALRERAARARDDRRRDRRRGVRCGPRGACGSSVARNSFTSRTLAENAARALGVRRLVGQQLAVLFERRAAAGRVDDDRVDRCVLEALDQRAREALRFVEPARMQRERAAAALTRRNADVAALGAEHAHRRGVDVREERALHAAGDEADARARAAVFGAGERRRRRGAGRRTRAAAAARRAAPSARRQQAQQPRAPHQALQPALARRRPAAARSTRKRAGYGMSAKISVRNARSSGARGASASTVARVDSISRS